MNMRLLLIIATLASIAVAAGATSQATAAPQTATGYATFQYPRTVATFMTTYLNTHGGYSGVHTTEVNRYRITLRGTYTGFPFTAYFTKVGRQTVKITLYVLGQHMSRTTNVGFDL